MRTAFFKSLPLPFFLAAHLLCAQLPCDSLAAGDLLAKSMADFDAGQLQRALDEALLAMKHLEQCKPDSNQFEEVLFHTDACYQALALDFIQRGQFNRGIDLAERCIALHRQGSRPNADRLANAYQIVSNAQNLNGNPKLAIENAEKAMQIRQMANPSDPKIANHFDAIVANYIALEDTVHARSYLELWNRFHQRLASKVSLQAKVRLANYWSMYFESTGETLLAIRVLEDTLALYGEQLKAKGGFLGIAEFHLCELYTQAGNYSKALFYAEKNVTMFEERLRRQRGKLFGRSHYAWCLAQSARASWHLFLETKDSSLQKQAQLRCEQAENVVFDMRDRAPNDGFREWIANEIGIVANIAEVRQGLFAQTREKAHLERAFESIEASKTFALQEFLHETYALQWSELPDSSYQQEINYRQQVNDLETNFFMVRNLPDADSLIAANDQALFVLRDQYRAFLDDLAQRQPDYFRLKYGSLAVSIPQVQSKILGPGQCLLDMYLENEKVFLMLVRPDTVVWLATPLEKRFEKALAIFGEETRHFEQYEQLPEQEYLQKVQAFADASNWVYQTLIAPLRPLLTEEVLLIPRDQLANLPFGALLTQKETNMGKPFLWHFLDNELVLSQAYSVGMFQFTQNRSPDKKPFMSVLAIAPFFEAGVSEGFQLPVGELTSLTRVNIFKPLPNSGTEAVNIAQTFGGDAILGKKATKAAFINAYKAYNILHFATHSAANDVLGEYSFVAFQQEKRPQEMDLLYAKDIYGLRIPADLVVLSACETAKGQYRKDEGVVGLTRAFSCAGARNVVASLWPVNDASTQGLMTLFYQEIKKGEPYNRALAHAKRTFIKANRSNAFPYYWAGFMLNGR